MTDSTFPSFTKPEKEKDAEYHRQVIQSIIKGHLNANFGLRYNVLNECAMFFNTLDRGENFDFLQNAIDGSALPAKWLDLNTIRSKLNILMGEFLENGYDVSVKAINKDAISRKLLEKERLLVEMRLRPIARVLEQAANINLTTNENLPQDEEELEDYINFSYKETSEYVMENALKWLTKKQNFDEVRFNLFRDLLIFGQAFAVEEMVGSLPTTRRVDPRNVIYDPNATDDFLSDASFWGEIQYMNLADCVERYGLSKEEIEDLTTAGKKFLEQVPPVTTTGNLGSVVNNNRIYYFNGDSQNLRVLVFTAYWVDVLPWNHKAVKDKYGREHIKFTNKTRGENIIKRYVKVWRKGTLIGDRILKDWGLMENMVRSVDNYQETKPPFVGFIPHFIDGMSLSLVQQLQPIRALKNIIAYNLQLTLARAGAKGITIDVSQIPEGMDIDKVIKYLKVVGVNLIDSRKDGIPAQFNQFQQYDLSISNNLVHYLTMMNALDAEMDKVSGINDVRQGVIQGATQTVGVTNSALLQSNRSTTYLFTGIRWLSTKILEQKAGLVKIAWANKEQFAPIIGDVGIDFLKQDIDLDLNDYGVFVEEVPPMLGDLNTFKQLVLTALQSGSVDFADALELLIEKDVSVGIRRFRKILMRREKEQALLAQQQFEMQQEQAARLSTQKDMVTMSKAEIQAQLERERLENDLQRILTKGRIDLGKERLRLLKS